MLGRAEYFCEKVCRCMHIGEMIECSAVIWTFYHFTSMRVVALYWFMWMYIDIKITSSPYGSELGFDALIFVNCKNWSMRIFVVRLPADPTFWTGFSCIETCKILKCSAVIWTFYQFTRIRVVVCIDLWGWYLSYIDYQQSIRIWTGFSCIETCKILKCSAVIWTFYQFTRIRVVVCIDLWGWYLSYI